MQPVNEILACSLPPEKLQEILQLAHERALECLKIMRELIDHIESASEGGQSDGK